MYVVFSLGLNKFVLATRVAASATVQDENEFADSDEVGEDDDDDEDDDTENDEDDADKMFSISIGVTFLDSVNRLSRSLAFSSTPIMNASFKFSFSLNSKL